ncbi:MAG: ADP-ribosylglycohydrolase family protein, partial [Planctomycetota bacterium]|nr:ADP-ribosylglycohydrolase family protein [Planctomycetota bacterium]
ASAVFARGIDLVLRLSDPSEFSSSAFIEELVPVCVGGSSLQKKILGINQFIAEERPTQEVIEILGNGTLAIESVATALYVFCGKAQSFQDTVIHGVSMAGDTDTIGAMCGALAGALHGLDAIPSLWMENLENGAQGRDFLLELGARIFRHWHQRLIGEIPTETH